jgi:hypothetical protein
MSCTIDGSMATANTAATSAAADSDADSSSDESSDGSDDEGDSSEAADGDGAAAFAAAAVDEKPPEVRLCSCCSLRWGETAGSIGKAGRVCGTGNVACCCRLKGKQPQDLPFLLQTTHLL